MDIKDGYRDYSVHSCKTVVACLHAYNTSNQDTYIYGYKTRYKTPLPMVIGLAFSVHRYITCYTDDCVIIPNFREVVGRALNRERE
jgi:hypothetical protein